MSSIFEKWKDPAFLAEVERKQAERDAREQRIINWRETTVGATGHRPDEMGGFDDTLGGYKRNHPIVIQLRTNLLEILEDFIVNQGKSRFVSGGALGFDSLFFWAVDHLKKKYPHIQNILAIPFVKQDRKWSKEQKRWYKKMLEVADEVIDVARWEEYSTNEDRGTKPIPLDDYSNEKMKERNKFIVDQSSVLVAFYNGSNGGTGHCVQYACTNYFNRPRIIRMDPRFGCKPEHYW